MRNMNNMCDIVMALKFKCIHFFINQKKKSSLPSLMPINPKGISFNNHLKESDRGCEVPTNDTWVKTCKEPGERNYILVRPGTTSHSLPAGPTVPDANGPPLHLGLRIKSTRMLSSPPSAPSPLWTIYTDAIPEAFTLLTTPTFGDSTHSPCRRKSKCI